MNDFTTFIIALVVLALVIRLARRWFLNWFDTVTTMNTIKKHQAKDAKIIVFKTEHKTHIEQLAKAKNCTVDDILNNLIEQQMKIDIQ